MENNATLLELKGYVYDNKGDHSKALEYHEKCL